MVLVRLRRLLFHRASEIGKDIAISTECRNGRNNLATKNTITESGAAAIKKMIISITGDIFWPLSSYLERFS